MLTGVAAIGFLLLLFAGALNLALDEYAKGALHAAVDEGAQAGAAAGGSLAACQAEAAQVQAGLLHGAFGSGVTITCTVQGNLVVASASGSLPSLLPVVPRVEVAATGVSVIEQGPLQ